MDKQQSSSSRSPPLIMLISDITRFLACYNGCPELLFKWMVQFDIDSQVAFIALVLLPFRISQYTRSAIRNPNTPITEHDTCACRSFYASTSSRFKATVELLLVRSCIKRMDWMQPPAPQVDVHVDAIEYEFKHQDVTLQHVYRQHFNSNFFARRDATDPSAVNGAHPLVAVMMHIADSEYLYETLDCVELYTLFQMGQMLTRRDFDRLLSEVDRSIARGTSTMKLVRRRASAQILHDRILGFHLNRHLFDGNTELVYSMRLPRTVLLSRHISRNLSAVLPTLMSKYVVQPNFRGLRVGIAKNKGFMYTFNNCGQKLKMRGVSLKLFRNIDSFSGEFMIIGYRVTGETPMQPNDAAFDPFRKLEDRDDADDDTRPPPTSELDEVYFNVHAASYHNHMCLVLVDLFVWNSINYLQHSYLERLNAMLRFIRAVDHPRVKMSPVITDTQQYLDLRDHFISQRQSMAMANGILFRSKYINFPQQLTKVKFEVSVFKLVQRHGRSADVVVERDEVRRVEVTGSILPYVETRYSFYALAYDVKPVVSRLKLAVMYLNELRPYAILDLPFMLNNSTHTGLNMIKFASGETYNSVVVKVFFNDFDPATGVIADVQNVEMHPDVSLIECLTHSELEQLRATVMAERQAMLE